MPLMIAAYEGFVPLFGPSGTLDAAGRFRTVPLPPGRYLLTAGGTSGWRTQSVIVNGRETLGSGGIVLDRGPVSDVLIRLVSGDTQSISGTVRDALGRPRDDVTLYLFPQDQQLRRFGTRVEFRPSASGVYRLDDIPPGDYFLAGIVGAGPDNWESQVEMAQLARQAEQVSLLPRQQRTVNLRLP
jgi:hypothetical protein